MDYIVRSAAMRGLCALCRQTSMRKLSTVREARSALRPGLQNNDRIGRRHKAYIATAGGQARPIEGFYAELLSKPKKEVPNITSTGPRSSESETSNEREERLEKARTVFGSRLPRHEERRAELEAQSHMVAGIMVPPKPTEPDNCCMSGCVNCVWDMFRDEMEEWAAKNAEARAALQAHRESGKGSGAMLAQDGTPSHVASSMDDDGGGSETNWGAGTGPDSLFDDIPVGIREFMRTEKKLKQKHKQEATASG